MLLPAGQVGAHTVPSMVAEAEFSPKREMVLLVNLDPRLILTDQPSAVPPVPASWWFEQDEKGRADTLTRAAAYVDAQLKFRVGSTDLHGAWKVQPVDSATVTPVTPSSAEVHLLVEHRGPLPEAQGDFKLTVSRTCAVATLLVNAMAGDEQRQPQLVFPGESSRGFVLPALAAKAEAGSPAPPTGKEAVAKPAPAPAPAPGPTSKLAPGHTLWAHGLFAVAITCVLLGRFWSAVVVLLVFHGSACVAAWMTWQGWLPVQLGGIPRSCWILLGGTALALLLVRRIPPALLVMAALAGFLHGWGPWNLRTWQGAEQSLAGLFQREGLLTLVELAAAGVSVPAMRYVARRFGIPLAFRQPSD
ncbi:MAG: hypothetical protein ACAH88_14965 [Roseimicrobium sp.]